MNFWKWALTASKLGKVVKETIFVCPSAISSTFTDGANAGLE
nr:MAG TPA: hypothetical protein [Caudoviricetes sp.]